MSDTGIVGRLGRLLEAAEAASPVEAVHSVTRELGEAFGATEVSFLIADLSGRALVRLAHVPLGLFADTRFRGNRVVLEPGDRLVFVTDGMLERNAADLDLATIIDGTRALHPREAARQMADTVLAVTGHDLRDDATILLLDWYGEHGHSRTTVAGADQGLASARLA